MSKCEAFSRKAVAPQSASCSTSASDAGPSVATSWNAPARAGASSGRKDNLLACDRDQLDVEHEQPLGDARLVDVVVREAAGNPEPPHLAGDHQLHAL